MAMAGTLEDRLAAIVRLSTSASADPRILARWQKLATDPEKLVRDRALGVLADHFPGGSVDLFVEQLPLADYSTQQVLVKALTAAAATQGTALLERLLPLVASGDAGTRSAILKILMGMPDHREVVKRFVVFSKTLAGWARDRALESMRAFGDAVLEPAIELLSDPDVDIRASAMQLAQSFEDPRLVPATVALLKDPDWWIRITAAETLGRLKDVAGGALPRRGPQGRRRPLERRGGPGPHRRRARLSRTGRAAQGSGPRGPHRGHPGPRATSTTRRSSSSSAVWRRVTRTGRCARGPSSWPRRWPHASTRSSATAKPCEGGPLGAVRAGRAQDQPPPRRHP